MWLIVDDERDHGCEVVAKTFEAACTILGGVGYAFEGVCLDHDLGTGKTGYDVLMWALEGKILPPKVQLVTMNPIGRQRMEQALLSAGYEMNVHGIFIDPKRKEGVE